MPFEKVTVTLTTPHFCAVVFRTPEVEIVATDVDVPEMFATEKLAVPGSLSPTVVE